MSYYARFVEDPSGQRFRFDTRIYLCSCKNHRESDGECVAAFVGLNPGSAEPVNKTDLGSWAEIEGEGDPTLALIRRCFVGAGGKEMSKHPFVQVWNLFYQCEPASARVHRLAGAFSELRRCESEKKLRPKLDGTPGAGKGCGPKENCRSARKNSLAWGMQRSTTEMQRAQSTGPAPLRQYQGAPESRVLWAILRGRADKPKLR